MRKTIGFVSLSVALFLLVSGGLAVGQSGPPAVVSDDGTLDFPTTGYEVLYRQLDDPSGSAFIDTDLPFGKDGYDAEGADDFIVTSPAGWDIKRVNTPGVWSTSPGGALAEWVNTAFYTDAGGLPGAPLPGCVFPANVDFTDDGTGDLSVGVDCNAPPGVVWVSQQVRPLFFNLHYWSTRNAAAGNPFVWRNPLDGFDTGCTDWTPAATCGSFGNDTLFEILGKERTTGPATVVVGVPAVGPLGTGLLLLALAGACAYVLGRRRRP